MKKNKVGIPNKEQLKRELYREKQKLRRREVLFGTVEALTVAAAITVLAGFFGCAGIADRRQQYGAVAAERRDGGFFPETEFNKRRYRCLSS